MASLSDFLKTGIKTRLSRYGAKVEPMNFDQRLHNMQNRRKQQRHSIMLKKRDISKDTLTPINTPIPAKKKDKNKNQYKLADERDAVQERIEMLKKWQEEKKKRLKKEKEKAKPVFKVYHVLSTENDDLTKVYQELKGKPIQSKASTSNQFRLAPSSTYKFKPPANIKPINMDNKSTGVRTRRQLRFLDSPRNVNASKKPSSTKGGESNKNRNANVRKSEFVKGAPSTSRVDNNMKESVKNIPSTSGATLKDGTVKNRRAQFKKLNSKINTVVSEVDKTQSATKENSNRSKRTTKNPLKKDSKVAANVTASNQPNQKGLRSSRRRSASMPKSHEPLKDRSPSPVTNCSTPQLNRSITYISPYVTVSRGKNNARMEYHRRSFIGDSNLDSSLYGKEDFSDSTSPKAAAAYFRKLVNNQMSRLQALCMQWSSYKEGEMPPEEACDMINVVIGQTDLLLSKKFNQFRGLIEACETRNSQKPVNCLDLHGYWDTVMMQVSNLDKRFDNLECLKRNGWEEILPVVARPKSKPKPKRKTEKQTNAISGLRAAIQEARKRKAALKQADQEAEQEVFFPSSSTPQMVSTKRISLRKSVLISGSKRRISSPGLTLMKVTQAAKSADKFSDTPEPSNGQPESAPKSILKARSSKSMLRKSKIVLFKENGGRNEAELKDDLENDANISNLISFTPDNIVQTPRRSSRLLTKSSVSKL